MTESVFETIRNNDEEQALAWLLKYEYLLVTNIKTYKGEYTVALMVNVSDIMAWGVAEAEPIEFCDNYGEPDEPTPIIDYFKLVTSKGYYGTVEWVCKKRNQQPQKAVKNRMINDGYWSDEMEALPPNQYDQKMIESIKKHNSK